jgi:isoleucyl-tRNA synthetase
MLANNDRIEWLPEHIKSGRFGNFLETNVDWALSRERYWGTPLPIWKCETTGKAEAVPSYAALVAKPGMQGTDVFEKAKAANPKLSDDLRVHKPYLPAGFRDEPLIDEMLKESRKKNLAVREFIHTLVRSEEFHTK